MSYISECSNRDSYVWAVERPIERRSRYSPVFNHNRYEFRFEISVKSKIYTMRIVDVKTANMYGYIYYLPRYINVHVEDRNGCALPLSNKYERELDPETNNYRDVIWQYDDAAILKAIPDFYANGLLIFLILFDATDGETLLRNSSPIERNVEKEEKCVQVNTFSCIESLSEDLSKLLDESSHCDVLVNCKDRHLKAHKCILSARSRIIASALKNDQTDNRIGVFHALDVDPSVFDPFIRYLYSGNLPNLTVDTAKSLYKAADSYKVASLKRRCSRFLQDHLNTENACEFLELANSYVDTEFKEVAMDYILEHKVHLQDDLWMPFCERQSKLANEVYNRYFKLEIK